MVDRNEVRAGGRLLAVLCRKTEDHQKLGEFLFVDLTAPVPIADFRDGPAEFFR